MLQDVLAQNVEFILRAVGLHAARHGAVLSLLRVHVPTLSLLRIHVFILSLLWIHIFILSLLRIHVSTGYGPQRLGALLEVEGVVAVGGTLVFVLRIAVVFEEKLVEAGTVGVLARAAGLQGADRPNLAEDLRVQLGVVEPEALLRVAPRVDLRALRRLLALEQRALRLLAEARYDVVGALHVQEVALLRLAQLRYHVGGFDAVFGLVARRIVGLGRLLVVEGHGGLLDLRVQLRELRVARRPVVHVRLLGVLGGGDRRVVHALLALVEVVRVLLPRGLAPLHLRDYGAGSDQILCAF